MHQYMCYRYCSHSACCTVRICVHHVPVHAAETRIRTCHDHVQHGASAVLSVCGGVRGTATPRRRRRDGRPRPEAASAQRRWEGLRATRLRFRLLCSR